MNDPMTFYRGFFSGVVGLALANIVLRTPPPGTTHGEYARWEAANVVGALLLWAVLEGLWWNVSRCVSAGSLP